VIALGAPLTWLCQAALAGGLTAADEHGLDAAYTPQRVAMVVGVDSYGDPELPSLRFAAKDATDLAEVLEDPSYGQFDRVWVLTGAEATTGRAIREALELATAELQRDDTFLLYLSGHGTLTLDGVEGTRLWFLPSDGELQSARDTGVAVTWLEEQVARVAARRRVLILDTCHNGREKSSLGAGTERLLAGMRGDPPPPRALREVSESEARLYAAQYYQPALEDPDLGNGVYTHFLLRALTDDAADADLSGDGLVDVAEAHDWARDRTIGYTGGIQVPRAEYRIVGREEIFLAGRPGARAAAERALLAATDALIDGAQVLIDGVPRGVLPDVVPLEPGRHRVEIQDARGRTLARQPVRVVAGETVMADSLLWQSRPGVELIAAGLTRRGETAGMHAAAGELELGWVDPLRGPWWLASDLHIRGSLGAGELDEEPGVEMITGVVSAGGGAGWRPVPLLALGPQVELAAPWRYFETDGGVAHRQAMITVALGGRAVARVAVGERLFASLRYDLRYLPYYYFEAGTSTLEQSLGLGLGARL